MARSKQLRFENVFFWRGTYLVCVLAYPIRVLFGLYIHPNRSRRCPQTGHRTPKIFYLVCLIRQVPLYICVPSTHASTRFLCLSIYSLTRQGNTFEAIYLYMWTISPRVYNPHSSKCFGTDMDYKIYFFIEIYSSSII